MGGGDRGDEGSSQEIRNSARHDDGSGDSAMSPMTDDSMSEKENSPLIDDGEEAKGEKTQRFMGMEDTELIYQRYHLGLSLMNLAFNLDSWDGMYQSRAMIYILLDASAENSTL